ncbi:MAG: bifunctional heptose 7-phosphate kinase/heptose 1-phosphate adenyltransferase [Acidobacteria bacterium]|nr:bifunctional heptose 7-phosphate kinase/heptose 1-phosphate adenyltransferase [Acidobacteriota bacterium]
MREIPLPPPGSKAARPRILVMGDVMLDRLIQGEARRLSVEAPVPIVLQQSDSQRAGGAANVAVNLAALGAQVVLTGVVGRDSEAESLEQVVREGGVEGVHFVSRADLPTTVKTRIVAHRQQIARLDREAVHLLDADSLAGLLAVLRREIPRSRAILVPDYGKGVVTPSLWSSLVELCAREEVPLLVDPSPRAAAGDYQGASLVKPNWAEALRAARRPGEEPPGVEEIGRRWLAASDALAVLITRGEAGMSLFRPHQPAFHAPAQRRDVFDVTGAGDTVLATMGWAMAAGLELEDATWLANLAGGLAVERFGTARIGRRELQRGLAPEGDLEDKLISRGALESFLAAHRREGRRIVFTNGCFDILHPGHLRLLRRCAACGDVVVVGLNSDSSVRRLKGARRPVLSAGDRALVLAALPEVHAVVIFEEDTPAELIAQVLPDVLVKGGDYRPEDVVGRDLVEGRGGRLELIPLRAGISTSRLVEGMEAHDPADDSESRSGGKN